MFFFNRKSVVPDLLKNNFGKDKVREHMLSICTIMENYYKVTISKTLWYWQRDEHTDQWSGVENPQVDPHEEGQLTVDNSTNATQQERKPFQQMALEHLAILIAK